MRKKKNKKIKIFIFQKKNEQIAKRVFDKSKFFIYNKGDILWKESFTMYNDAMNAIPDFVHVLLSWLEVIFGSLLEYLGILEYPSHEGTDINDENTEG